MRRVLLIVLLALAVAAPVAAAVPWGVPLELWSARRLEVFVGEQRLELVANPGNGMLGIASLGALDGMLFELESPVEPLPGYGFWMRGMDRPLDIVFFDPAGRAIETLRMEPCAAEPCVIYVPRSTYQWAIESEVGALQIHPGDILRLQ